MGNMLLFQSPTHPVHRSQLLPNIGLIRIPGPCFVVSFVFPCSRFCAMDAHGYNWLDFSRVEMKGLHSGHNISQLLSGALYIMFRNLNSREPAFIIVVVATRWHGIFSEIYYTKLHLLAMKVPFKLHHLNLYHLPFSTIVYCLATCHALLGCLYIRPLHGILGGFSSSSRAITSSIAGNMLFVLPSEKSYLVLLIWA